VHDDTQQGSFTGTIIANQSCFFTVFYMETGVLKDDFFAKRFTDILT
jgi:hypothetical protein